MKDMSYNAVMGRRAEIIKSVRTISAPSTAAGTDGATSWMITRA